MSKYINPNVKDTLKELYKEHFDMIPASISKIKKDDCIIYIRRDYEQPTKWKLVNCVVDEVDEDIGFQVHGSVPFRVNLNARSSWVIKKYQFKDIKFFKQYTDSDYKYYIGKRINKINKELLKYMCKDVVGIISDYGRKSFLHYYAPPPLPRNPPPNYIKII